MSKILPPEEQAADQLQFVKLSYVAYKFNVDSRTIHRMRRKGHLPGCKLVGLKTWVMPEALFEQLKTTGLPYYSGTIKPIIP